MTLQSRKLFLSCSQQCQSSESKVNYHIMLLQYFIMFMFMSSQFMQMRTNIVDEHIRHVNSILIITRKHDLRSHRLLWRRCLLWPWILNYMWPWPLNWTIEFELDACMRCGLIMLLCYYRMVINFFIHNIKPVLWLPVDETWLDALPPCTKCYSTHQGTVYH